MAHYKGRYKTQTMAGQVGRLREGEKFYKNRDKLPYTVIDPFHRMGVKCKHPHRKGYSYFEPTREFHVDLRFVPLVFVNRSLATNKQG